MKKVDNKQEEMVNIAKTLRIKKYIYQETKHYNINDECL